MHCKDCGKQIDEDSRFCRFCGKAQSSPPQKPIEKPVGTSTAATPDKPTDSDKSVEMVAWGGGLIFLFIVLLVLVTGQENTPAASDTNLMTDANVVGVADIAANMDLEADPSSAEVPEPNWSYSTDQDKVRGATTYYARTTSTNSIYQDSPYDSETTMDMLVRESPAHGTDVLLVISSGQMMCPSYDGCEGTVRFDDGSAEVLRFNGPADNSSETIFVIGADRFIARLKKSKKVVIEKTLYQAGNPQFEFNVDGLEWEH